MFERCLYFNLNALTRQVNKIWIRAFEPFKLSPSHAYLLRAVLAQPGMTQGKISKELKLEKSTITRFVDHLEQIGLVTREKSGREQLIFPTSKSQSMRDHLEQQGEQLYQHMLTNLGKEELTHLVTALRAAKTQIE